MTLDDLIDFATAARLPITLIASVVILFLLNRFLRRRWRDNPEAQFYLQMILLGLTLVAAAAVILALPINENLRGQFLGLLGVVVSAAIAFSSTTFIGNIMAGLMLRVVKTARPGDFVTVADLTGRITEMDLLHTELQTEFRDLVTVPNLYLVTQPVRVVRSSGTIISAEVSIGYDVPRTDVASVLCKAAADSGLADPFVHVRELGDYAILYRIAGLLEDVKSLISARSRLRETMLDSLHSAGIEIVSPTFMNSRVLPVDKEFIPAPTLRTRAPVQPQAEEIVFDKADEAASIEELRKSIARTDEEIAGLAGEESPARHDQVARLEARKARLVERLEAETKRLREVDLEEKG